MGSRARTGAAISFRGAKVCGLPFPTRGSCVRLRSAGEDRLTAENHQDFAEAKTAPQVAIVDDESGVRQTLVRGLERHGFLCRPFRSGVDFLDSLEFKRRNF